MQTSNRNGVALAPHQRLSDAIVADPVLAQIEFRANRGWIDGGHSRRRTHLT